MVFKLFLFPGFIVLQLVVQDGVMSSSNSKNIFLLEIPHLFTLLIVSMLLLITLVTILSITILSLIFLQGVTILFEITYVDNHLVVSIIFDFFAGFFFFYCYSGYL